MASNMAGFGLSLVTLGAGGLFVSATPRALWARASGLVPGQSGALGAAGAAGEAVVPGPLAEVIPVLAEVLAAGAAGMAVVPGGPPAAVVVSDDVAPQATSAMPSMVDIATHRRNRDVATR